MKANQHQTTQQTQRLTLTPTMRMALKVLQMPVLELKLFLEQQVEENPLLELESDTAPLTQSDDPQSPSEDPTPDETFQDLDDNAMEALADEDRWEAPEPNEDAKRLIESHPDKPSGLHEALRTQLRCLRLSSSDLALGELLITHLDEHGYLSTSLEELSQQAQVPSTDLERLLGILQSFEPTGVGARNLRECLLLQLRHQGQTDHLAFRIVRDHFPVLLQRNLKRLASRCRRPPQEVEAACQLIRTLSPRPYHELSREAARPLYPDLTVCQVDGRYDVELVDDQLPGLVLSVSYRRMLKNPDTPVDVKQFLHERLRQATWLLRAIEQRHTTLLSIARCILAVQRDFLEQGPQALKPLTHAQVAQAIGRHPSTVGRAIAGKSLATPYGILPLERFFASRIPQQNANHAVSDATIKAETQALIAQEDPAHPLSDEAIVARLRERGLTVARRTVAKYRSRLKILPAHLRRRTGVSAGNGSMNGSRNGWARQVEQEDTPTLLSPLTDPASSANGRHKALRLERRPSATEDQPHPA